MSLTQVSGGHRPKKIMLIHSATGKVIMSVTAASAADVDLAVEAAEKAYRTSWGLKIPGAQRGRLLAKFADLVEENGDELAALESLNVGEYYCLIQILDCHVFIGRKDIPQCSEHRCEECCLHDQVFLRMGR